MKVEMIEQMIKQIGERHNAYCAFSIRSSREEGEVRYNDVEYESYIAVDPKYPHVRHTSLEDVYARFEQFYQVEDMQAFLEDRTAEEIRQLEITKKDIDDKIEWLKAKLEIGV